MKIRLQNLRDTEDEIIKIHFDLICVESVQVSKKKKKKKKNRIETISNNEIRFNAIGRTKDILVFLGDQIGHRNLEDRTKTFHPRFCSQVVTNTLATVPRSWSLLARDLPREIRQTTSSVKFDVAE